MCILVCLLFRYTHILNIHRVYTVRALYCEAHVVFCKIYKNTQINNMLMLKLYFVLFLVFLFLFCVCWIQFVKSRERRKISTERKRKRKNWTKRNATSQCSLRFVRKREREREGTSAPIRVCVFYMYEIRIANVESPLEFNAVQLYTN